SWPVPCLRNTSFVAADERAERRAGWESVEAGVSQAGHGPALLLGAAPLRAAAASPQGGGSRPLRPALVRALLGSRPGDAVLRGRSHPRPAPRGHQPGTPLGGVRGAVARGHRAGGYFPGHHRAPTAATRRGEERAWLCGGGGGRPGGCFGL